MNILFQDDFSAGPVGGIGASWTRYFPAAGASTLQIGAASTYWNLDAPLPTATNCLVFDASASTVSGNQTGGAYYNGATYADAQIHAVIASHFPNSFRGVTGRLTNPGTATETGYKAIVSHTSSLTVQLVRTVNGVNTTLGTPLTPSSFIGTPENFLVILYCNGTNIRLGLQRLDSTTQNGYWFVPDPAHAGQGTWQPGQRGTPLWALNLTDSVISGAGSWGLTKHDVGGSSFSISGVTNTANPTITTTAAHGFKVGQPVFIKNVQGAIGVNGVFNIATVPSTTTLTVPLGAGPGNYVAGTGTANQDLVQWTSVVLGDVPAVSGPPATAITSPAAASTQTGPITVTATSTGVGGANILSMILSVDGKQYGEQLFPGVNAASGSWWVDTEIFQNGSHTLAVTAMDDQGNAATASAAVTTSNSVNIVYPVTPRRNPNISIWALDYASFLNALGSGQTSPIDGSAQYLAANQYDVIIGASTTATMAATTDSPVLYYANCSNVYNLLIPAWSYYADTHGLPRENLYAHTSAPLPWGGSNAGSTIPTALLWGVYALTSSGTNLVDHNRNANVADTNLGTYVSGSVATGVSLGSIVGDIVYFGYPEEFDEIDAVLAQAAGAGFTYVLEVPTAFDANHVATPGGWTAVSVLSDGTAGLTKNGPLRFDPVAARNAGWKAGYPGYIPSQLVNIVGVTNTPNPTISTVAAHNLKPGQMANVAGVGGAVGVNGPQLVLTVPNGTSFTVKLASAPGPYTPGTGTVSLQSGVIQNSIGFQEFNSYDSAGNLTFQSFPGLYLHWARLRITALGAAVPKLATLMCPDFQQFYSGSPVIPAWDPFADADGDGYLNDAEYANRGHFGAFTAGNVPFSVSPAINAQSGTAGIVTVQLVTTGASVATTTASVSGQTITVSLSTDANGKSTATDTTVYNALTTGPNAAAVAALVSVSPPSKSVTRNPITVDNSYAARYRYWSRSNTVYGTWRMQVVSTARGYKDWCKWYFVDQNFNANPLPFANLLGGYFFDNAGFSFANGSATTQMVEGFGYFNAGYGLALNAITNGLKNGGYITNPLVTTNTGPFAQPDILQWSPSVWMEFGIRGVQDTTTSYNALANVLATNAATPGLTQPPQQAIDVYSWAGANNPMADLHPRSLYAGLCAFLCQKIPGCAMDWGNSYQGPWASSQWPFQVQGVSFLQVPNFGTPKFGVAPSITTTGTTYTMTRAATDANWSVTINYTTNGHAANQQFAITGPVQTGGAFGQVITVTLATDGNGTVVTTDNDLANATWPDAVLALVTPSRNGNPSVQLTDASLTLTNPYIGCVWRNRGANQSPGVVVQANNDPTGGTKTGGYYVLDVTLGTDANGAVTSTDQQIADLINGTSTGTGNSIPNKLLQATFIGSAPATARQQASSGGNWCNAITTTLGSPTAPAFVLTQLDDPQLHIVGNGVTNVTNTINPTITTAVGHTLHQGDKVTIAGTQGATGVNGTFLVASAPTGTTFTITLPTLPGVFTPGGGTVGLVLNSTVMARWYGDVLILYKPLSVNNAGGIGGTVDDVTATTITLPVHNASNSFIPVNAFGVLGSPTSTYTLRNGEGVILISTAAAPTNPLFRRLNRRRAGSRPMLATAGGL